MIKQYSSSVFILLVKKNKINVMHTKRVFQPLHNISLH